MKVIDDGVIKYDRSNFSLSGPLESFEYQELEFWRNKLFKIGLIGEYPTEKIGFGNMSTVKDYSQFTKSIHPQFIITGTQTGKYSELSGSHYTRVLDYNINKLQIKMMGCIEASSEALTHAAIYESNDKIKAVFHIHSSVIWKKMIEDNLDFTAAHIPYGTVEMAIATKKCISGKTNGVFCMHGHEDGIVIYSESLELAGNRTLDLYDKYFK